jgi:hypothetical protein
MRIICCLENPLTSWMWSAPPLQLLSLKGHLSITDYCQFGTPWRKSTKVLVSTSTLNNSRKTAALENITCVLQLESLTSSCPESTPLEISRGLRSPSLTLESGACLGGNVLTMPYKMLEAPK